MEDWRSSSEIVAGLILKEEIDINSVRPELFHDPYDDLIAFLQSKEGNIVREDVVLKIGVNPFNTAMYAAEATNGYKVNWVGALERAKLHEELANRFEHSAKRLRTGKEVDYINIVEQIKSVENEDQDIENLNSIGDDGYPFFDTGWKGWDEHVCGLPKVGMTILGGDTKSGKTTAAIKLAGNFLKQHNTKKVVFVTLEMSKAQIKGRINELGKLTTGEKNRFHVVDQLWNIDKLPNKCASIPNLGFVVLDNVDFLVNENTEQEFSKAYRTFTKMTKRLYIPGLMLAQFSNQYHSGVPHPRQIKYTSSARQLASMTALIYNPNKDLLADGSGSHTLPAVPGSAYICFHLIRGGFRNHLDDNPGAILFPYSDKKGWGNKGSWMKLKP